LISFSGNLLLGFLPILSLSLVAKTAENSVDYSLQNTAGNSLFLVVSRDAKYKAKAVIDSFLWRVGDVLSAAGVWLGGVLGATTRHFTALNALLALGWLGLVLVLSREHRRLLKRQKSPDPAMPSPVPA